MAKSTRNPYAAQSQAKGGQQMKQSQPPMTGGASGKGYAPQSRQKGGLLQKQSQSPAGTGNRTAPLGVKRPR